MSLVQNTMTEESRRLIDQALIDGKVTVYQPFLAPGSEAPRSTRLLVSQRRREFRKAAKGAK